MPALDRLNKTGDTIGDDADALNVVKPARVGGRIPNGRRAKTPLWFTLNLIIAEADKCKDGGSLTVKGRQNCKNFNLAGNMSLKP